jgi:hypothetical protein
MSNQTKTALWAAPVFIYVACIAFKIPFVLFRSNVPVFPGVMLVQAIQQYHRASR